MDAACRPSVGYLSYADRPGSNNGKATGSFKTDAFTEQANYYKTPNGNILQPTGWDTSVVRTDFPWSVTGYEASPLERIVEQGASGIAWQPKIATQSASGHTVKTEYGLNVTADAVKWWIVNPSDSTELVFYATYPKGTLHKKILMDENWVSGRSGTIEEFTNREGVLVLKRYWKTETDPIDTHYIYDVYGDLIYVLSAGIQTQPLSLSGVLFDQYVYAYRYDNKRRMTQKKLPGKGWEYIVYNEADQPIMTQDAVQRAKSPQQWGYTKYDNFGRIVETGILTATYSNQAAAQAAADLHARNTQKNWEERTVDTNPTSPTGFTRYTNQSFPVANLSPRMVNYYDDHKFEGANTVGLGLSGLTYENRNKTLTTGIKVFKEDGTAPLLTINYYDSRSRLIQSVSQNHLGGTDRITNTYTFVGELETSTHVHTANGLTTTTVTTNEYDHVGRLSATRHKVNG